MTNGFGVSPDRLPTLVEAVDQAHAHFTWIRSTVEGLAYDNPTMLVGEYGGAGHFSNVCRDFNIVFRRVLFDLGKQNDALTKCLERLSSGVQAARSEYLALEERTGERMSNISKSLDEGGV